MSIEDSDERITKKRKLDHDVNGGSESGKGVVRGNVSKKPAGENQPGPRISERHSTASSIGTTSLTTTGGVTKSALMQLQADELLNEIKPNYATLSQELKPALDKIVQAIRSTPARSPLSLAQAETALRQRSNLAIPFGKYAPESDIQYKFEYQPPTSIVVRGLFAQHLCAGNDLAVEIAAQMPAELLQDKDYLNYRAFRKRAYYLACIAAGLQGDLSNQVSIRYEYLDGVESTVILTLKLLTIQTQVKLCVNVIFPSSLGSVNKLTTNTNCVRKPTNIHNNDTADTQKPTPYYNSTLRYLASALDRDRLLDRAAQKCEAFSDACVLGYTWLAQRGFTSHVTAGGFGVSEWAYMCALLLQGGGHKGHPLFSDRYSSLQLFKAMLQVLANKDMTDPLVIGDTDPKMLANSTPILWDTANGVNVLFKLTPWSYGTLKQHAQLSLLAVNDRTRDNFSSIFITKVSDAALQYDEIYTITLNRLPSRDDNYYGTKLYDILEKGLGDRVVQLDWKRAPTAPWSVHDSGLSSTNHPEILTFGLVINADTTTRLIDHGPTAEQKRESEIFYQFWGEKSELRRFQDGSITETLLWSRSSPVTLQIIEHLSAHHFQIASNEICSLVPDLWKMRIPDYPTVEIEDAYKLINNKYQELSSKLHSLEALPLPIRSIAPADEALRSATIRHPLSSASVTPVDILIQFDSSTRWPDHLMAIQHTKIAFLTKLSDLVTESDSTLQTRVGVENTNASDIDHQNNSFLDIVYPSTGRGLTPLVFRLRIQHERELQLIQKALAQKTLQPAKRQALSRSLAIQKQMFVAAPQHTNTFRNLITQFPPLSATMRLLKSWFAAHYLTNHFADPVLEIIAAAVFLRPYPWSTPGNASAGFFRCLHLLAHWNWQSDPMIVDLSVSQDMTSDQITELETRFQAWRKLDPNMNNVAWFVGTSIDNTGTVWTQAAKPAKVVAARVSALAKAAVDFLRSDKPGLSGFSWNMMFISPLDSYDFVIHLNRTAIQNSRQPGNRVNDTTRYKNLQVQQDLDINNIGHDVVALFLHDLETVFSSVALFFHGHDRERIAALWRPGVSSNNQWRVRLGYSTVPYPGKGDESKDEASVIGRLNKDGILAEIATLGTGMIESITAKEAR